MSWTIAQSAERQIQLSHAKTAFTLTLSSRQPIAIAENDHHILAVIGRVRPYNEDYLSQDNALWLLTQPLNDAATLPRVSPSIG